MIFENYIPQGILGRYVQSFFYFEQYETLHSVDRFLPDGNVEVVFNLSDEPQYIYDNETLEPIQKCEKVWSSGIRTKPITIPSGSGSRMFVIIFKKGMAHPFFPFPMNEISNLVVEADSIWSHEISFLRDEIGEATLGEERFRAAENFLLRRLVPDFPTSMFVEYGLNQIIERPTYLRLSRLVDEVGYSKKHFLAKFKQHIGVTPKSYLRIMRFQTAVEEIEKNKPDWSEVALDCGFFDQSHFINDFKTFSGFTPSEYLLQKNGNKNYVPITS